MNKILSTFFNNNHPKRMSLVRLRRVLGCSDSLRSGGMPKTEDLRGGEDGGEGMPPFSRCGGEEVLEGGGGLGC